ncbi:hypothetical protein [Paenibacillus piscarius]|uniref:hypothetical protein n=1 Tax=Paenibacillus piscarius TaxID=1089681 RepID=UPI001EE821A4|nr:hypothetical protein [Paenibacillus piscarius]
MEKSRSYTGLITGIYVAALAATLISFFTLGFSESLMRFVVTLLAVCIAETVVYGYALMWLRGARKASRTSPVWISGAIIVALYMAVVLAAAIMLDWILELNPLWYAGIQIILLLAAAAVLAAVGLHGWNAASGERRAKDASRHLRTHRQELQDISRLARGWQHPEAGRLSGLLDELAEKFRYSDPVSRPGLSATEDILRQQLSLLHDHVALLLTLTELPADWDVETQELTNSIASTLARRNQELAALK